jgi:hypothetical protein
VVGGVSGGCTDHGQLYFDVSKLWPDMPIVSATLNLYTPRQTGPSGVQIVPNVPPSGGPLGFYDPVSWEPPSWDSAPHPATNATPIAQCGSSEHWQSWGVTALVRQWVDHRAASNSGLTLESSSGPVVFASPLGVAADGRVFVLTQQDHTSAQPDRPAAWRPGSSSSRLPTTARPGSR